MVIVMPRFGRRDHDHERGEFDPPTPNIVALVPSKPTDPDLPVPLLDDAHLDDAETDAVFSMTPLVAYWSAFVAFGPSYAASWSAWIAARQAQDGELRFLRRTYRGRES